MMSFRKPALVILLILFVNLSAVRADELPRLPEEVFPSLDSVLKGSLTQSPRMMLRQFDLRIAQGDLLQAKSGMLPSISGYYQLSETKDQREDVSGTLDTSKSYYNVLLTQPIYHWGERRNNARIGEIRARIAEKRFAEAYRMLVLEVRGAYLALVTAKAQLASERFNRMLADEALNAGKDRVAKGVSSEGEIFQLRISAERAALTVETLEGNLASAKENFVMLTGLEEPTDDEIPDTIPALQNDSHRVDLLLGAFLGESDPPSMNLAILRDEVAVERLNYKNQRKRLLPKLNFIMGISQDEQSYSVNIAQKYGLTSQYIGLQVNWSIFDGFASRGAVASALARKRQAEENYNYAADNYQIQAQSASRAVKLAYRQMAINDRLLESSLQLLDFRRERFKEGAASEADVNNARAGYNSALVSATGARQNYLMKVAEFVSMIARDPVMQHVQLN